MLIIVYNNWEVLTDPHGKLVFVPRVRFTKYVLFLSKVEDFHSGTKRLSVAVEL